VRWLGRPVDAETRRRFGYMPEERGLYPKMRVLDQLVYLARLHGLEPADARARASEMVEALGVAERGRDRAESLSLGNQQRVQLAAALVHRPEVLVLDEPFSGLDPVGVDVLSEILRGQADGRRPGRLLQPPARSGRAAVRIRRDDRPRSRRRVRPDRGPPRRGPPPAGAGRGLGCRRRVARAGCTASG
jgi:hypothetical protein